MKPDAPRHHVSEKRTPIGRIKSVGREGKTYATIPDDRPDEPRGRPHIEVGTKIEIPDSNLNG
jgi:hypothetical protein